MRGLDTAQAALFAELFSEADALMKRIERLSPELLAAQEGLAGSASEILAAIERYRLTIQALTEQAQRSAVSHIIERTNAVCERSVAAHTEAMKTAARESLAGESSLQLLRMLRLADSLQGALVQVHRNRWQAVATHVLACLLTAALTAALLRH